MKALKKLGEELQRPQNRTDEKNAYLARARALQQKATELRAFFEVSTTTEPGQATLTEMGAIQNQIAGALQEIESWQPTFHSNKNQDAITNNLNAAQNKLAAIQQQADEIKQKQAKNLDHLNDKNDLIKKVTTLQERALTLASFFQAEKAAGSQRPTIDELEETQSQLGITLMAVQGLQLNSNDNNNQAQLLYSSLNRTEQKLEFIQKEADHLKQEEGKSRPAA